MYLSDGGKNVVIYGNQVDWLKVLKMFSVERLSNWNFILTEEGSKTLIYKEKKKERKKNNKKKKKSHETHSKKIMMIKK